MKKLISLLLVVAISMTCFTGCCLKHEYAPATCEEPPTCVKCGKIGEEEPLGHDWEDATCTKAKTCLRCHTTSGRPLEHSHDDSTGLCTRCGNACFTMNELISTFVDLCYTYESLTTNVYVTTLFYQYGSCSKSEYNEVINQFKTCYEYIVITANYIANHPEYDSSSDKFICFLNAFNGVYTSYNALAEGDDSTFLASDERIINAINKLEAYI